MSGWGRGIVLGAAVAALGFASGCGQGDAPVGAAAAPPIVTLAPENIATARVAELTAGPTISGQLTPAREATVRAQVGGSIESLTVDRGEMVKAGAVIAKIAARDLEQSFTSAQASVKAAETALSVARSEEQRTANLVKGGALAARDLEQAKNAVSIAEAQLASTKAREKATWQQLDDTNIRAPFAGTVSDRPASVGDVVAPGTPIATIIDPSSMRLEALVQSEFISQVQTGQDVRFTIRGFPDQMFTGRVERVSPTADPVTRQVSIFVSLPNVGGKLIAGLFAEGRVATAVRKGVVVPLAAIDETGPAPTVTRIKDNKAERAAVRIGVRQPETEMVEILAGIADGDVVVTGAAKAMAAGTAVKVVK